MRALLKTNRDKPNKNSLPCQNFVTKLLRNASFQHRHTHSYSDVIDLTFALIYL